MSVTVVSVHAAVDITVVGLIELAPLMIFDVFDMVKVAVTEPRASESNVTIS